jgi:diacylglycerol kinase family enzyme
MTAPVPVALIYNPEAGSRFGLRPRPSVMEVAGALRANGGEPELFATRAAGDGVLRGQEAARRFPVVAVLGGDGTINEVLNGVIAAGSGCHLLVLPGGSVNVLARDLGIPLDPCRAAALLREGAPRRLFLGRAQEFRPSTCPSPSPADAPGSPHSRYFALMAGAGLDASIVRALAGTRLKRALGVFAFIFEGLRHAFSYGFPRLKVSTENREAQGYFVVAGNSPGYAGWFSLTPEADPAAPGFQVAVITTRSVPVYFYLLFLALTGDMLRSRYVAHFNACRLSISSDSPAWLQLDGESYERLPVEIVCDGASVDFLVPRAAVMPAATRVVSQAGA